MRRFFSIWRHPADLVDHAGITLQNVPNREYTLRLFVENEEIELQKTDNRSWTPAQRQYALCFLTTLIRLRLCVCRDVSSVSEMRAEIQMRSGHSFWARIRQNSDVIDIQGLLKNYWDSTEHEFTIPSQSWPPTSPPISDTEAQRPFPLENTMGI